MSLGNKKLQPLNDGFLQMCEVDDISEPGEMPEKGLKVIAKMAYAERTVGMKRFWTALRESADVSLLVRCHLWRGCTTHNVVIMPDGEQYAIKQVQHIVDTSPPAMDLSLERLVEKYKSKVWWCE